MRVSTAWIQPTSTEPRLMVNRTVELEELRFELLDAIQAGIYSKKVLVTGPRGVGKSILALAVMQDIGEDKPTDVALVHIAGRSVTYRTLLQRFAESLSRAARDCFVQGAPAHAELDQLSLLGRYGQITWTQVETILTRYGIGATAKGPALVGELGGSLAWERQVSMGLTTGYTLVVSDELLHEACEHVLTLLMSHGKHTIVLFDDLDQVAIGGDRVAALEVFKRVLDLGPCLAIVHLRIESLVEEIRREIDHSLSVSPLTVDDQMWMLRERAKLQVPGDAQVVEALRAWEPAFRRLAQVVDTPLTFLRWVGQLLKLGPTPPADWSSRPVLLKLAGPWTQGIDTELLDRLLNIIDACAPNDVWCRRADLQRGASVLTSGGPGLTAAELDLLITHTEYLLPRNRLEAEPMYRVDPVLDLLRPSIVARLSA